MRDNEMERQRSGDTVRSRMAVRVQEHSQDRPRNTWYR